MNGFSFGGGFGGFGGNRGFSSPISFGDNGITKFYMNPKASLHSEIAAHYMPKLPDLDVKFPLSKPLGGSASIKPLSLSDVSMRVPDVKDIAFTPMIDRMVDLPKPAPKFEITSKTTSTPKVEITPKIDLTPKVVSAPKPVSMPNVQPSAPKEKLKIGMRFKEIFSGKKNDSSFVKVLPETKTPPSITNHDIKLPDLKNIGEGPKNGLPRIGDAITDKSSMPKVPSSVLSEASKPGATPREIREERRRVLRERMLNERLARKATPSVATNHDIKPVEEKSFLKKVGESLKNGLSHVGDVVADEAPVIVPNNAKDYHTPQVHIEERQAELSEKGVMVGEKCSETLEKVREPAVKAVKVAGATGKVAVGLTAKAAVNGTCAAIGSTACSAVPGGSVVGGVGGFLVGNELNDKMGVNEFIERSKEELTAAIVDLRNPQSEGEKAALTQSVKSGVNTTTAVAEIAGDIVASAGMAGVAKKAEKVLASGAKKLGAEAVESAKATLGVVTGNNGLRLAEATTGKETAVVLGKEAEKGPLALFAKGDGKGSTRIHKAGKVESAARIAATQADADKYLAGITSQKGVLGNKCLTVDKRYEYFEFKKNCEYMGIKFKKGDFISRDNLHHEWEWFRGAKNHRGPIDPLTGTVDVTKIDKSRILKIK